MQTPTTKTLLDAAREVPGIEVLDEPASESTKAILNFYPDQSEALVETLRKSRREEVQVRENADCSRVGIYRRALK